jgi:hypothetical protein
MRQEQLSFNPRAQESKPRTDSREGMANPSGRGQDTGRDDDLIIWRICGMVGIRSQRDIHV